MGCKNGFTPVFCKHLRTYSSKLTRKGIAETKKRTGMDRVRGSPWFLFRGCFLRGILYNTGGYTLDIRGSEIRDSVLHKKHINGQQRSKEGGVGGDYYAVNF